MTQIQIETLYTIDSKSSHDIWFQRHLDALDAERRKESNVIVDGIDEDHFDTNPLPSLSEVINKFQENK